MAGHRFTLDEAHRAFKLHIVRPESERAHRRIRQLAFASQVIHCLFGALYTLLAIRLVLVLLAASSHAGFVRFITAVTDPFYAPFRGIVPSTPILDGAAVLSVPILIAIASYVVLHAALNSLIRLLVYRTQIA